MLFLLIHWTRSKAKLSSPLLIPMRGLVGIQTPDLVWHKDEHIDIFLSLQSDGDNYELLELSIWHLVQRCIINIQTVHKILFVFQQFKIWKRCRNLRSYLRNLTENLLLINKKLIPKVHNNNNSNILITVITFCNIFTVAINKKCDQVDSKSYDLSARNPER